MRLPTLTVVLALATAMPAHAQLLRAVVKSADSVPAAGAILSVLDAQGRAVARAFVQENGFLEVRVPGAGRYGLRLDRAGTEAELLPPVDVSGLVTNLRVTPTRAPSPLGPGPQGVAPGSCRLGLELDGRLADLWESVRFGYVGIALGESGKQLPRMITRFERTLDVEAKKVVESRTLPAIRILERPYPALTADTLAKIGYIHGDSSYFAFELPDARVITSTAFAAQHCFSEVPGERIEEGKSWVGLAFAPAAEKPNRTEIGGVFWLERETARLVAFSFDYRPPPAAKGSFGGQQRYGHTAAGVPYVKTWVLRLPIYASRTTNETRAMLTPDRELRQAFVRTLSVTGVREEGGEAALLP